MVRYDVVVVGAGPVGGAAAALAAGAGLRTLALEALPLAGAGRTWGSRWQQVAVKGVALDTLREAGVDDTLLRGGRDVFQHDYEATAVLPLGETERALREAAESRGTTVRFDAPIGANDIRFPGSVNGTVQVRLPSGERVEAGAVFDASGGRTEIGEQLDMGLVWSDRTTHLLLGHYPAQPWADAAEPASRYVRALSGTHPQHGAYSGVVLNHPTAGAHVDFFLHPGEQDTTALHGALAAHAGIEGAVRETPHAIVAREAAAPAARMGSILQGGDTVERMPPGAGGGLTAGLADARRAIGALIAPDREAALRAYDRDTLASRGPHARRGPPMAVSEAFPTDPATLALFRRRS